MPTTYVHSVSFRGVELAQVVGGEVRMDIRLVRGLDEGSRVRGRDTVIPSLAGRIPRNRVGDGRALELEGFVSGVGVDHPARLADFRAAVDELMAIFDPTLAPGPLVVLLGDGTTASIDARTLPEEPEWGPDNILTFRALAVDLEAVGADWVRTP